jgi:hypothetical protein
LTLGLQNSGRSWKWLFEPIEIIIIEFDGAVRSRWSSPAFEAHYIGVTRKEIWPAMDEIRITLPGFPALRKWEMAS